MASERKDEDFKEQLNLLRIAMQEQKELLNTHQSTSNQLHQDYQAINKLTLDITSEFGKTGESMAKSIMKIKDAGQGYFDRFAEEHKEAIRLLEGLITDMSDAVNSAQTTFRK
jgi:archaellum component FlaC